MSAPSPTQSNSLWVDAIRAYHLGDYERAIELFGHVGDNARTNYNIAMALRKQGKHYEAIRYLGKGVRQEKQCAPIVYQRATCFIEMGVLRLAVLDLTSTLTLFNRETSSIDFSMQGISFVLEHAEVLYNRAIAFCGLGLYHRARDDLMTALSIRFATTDRQQLAEQLLEVATARVELMHPQSMLQPLQDITERIEEDDDDDDDDEDHIKSTITDA